MNAKETYCWMNFPKLNFLRQLNVKRSLPLLQVNITTILEEMTLHIGQLSQKEYYILVAGE